MAGQESKWRLADLAEFEALLRESGEGRTVVDRRRYKEAIAEAESSPRSETERRRLGLRVWLGVMRGSTTEAAGARINGAVRLAGVVLGVVAFLAGIGVMRGMLRPVEVIEKGYNVWIFLAVALGLQWLFLVGGLVGYGFVRRASGSLSLFQRGASWLAQRLAGKGDAATWQNLLDNGAGYRSVLSWRLARLTQGAAVIFNVGLLAGFFGCLFFLKVGFYWESTLNLSGLGLLEFLQGMAAPWAWSGIAPAPSVEDVEYALLPKFFFEREEVDRMWPFLMTSLAVYGLLPRLALWSWCGWKERRALAKIEFQAPRHRELWRELTNVKRSLPASGPADGVVLLDVGGTDIATESVREFLLRELRVNPQSRHTAAVLDEAREQEALEAIREADLGVVFLVEGWALSPKQMRVLHDRVRAMGGPKVPIHYVVVGELEDGKPSEPRGDEWEQWKLFVDGLRDPAAEVVSFRRPEEREGTS